MTDTSFNTFLTALLGEWAGFRRTAALEQEPVRSLWQTALDGSFLHEHWHTAGSGPSLEPTAQAFFRVSDSGPGDFIAVYRNGKIAFGESMFSDSAWTLTHRWLREPGIAMIRVRFLDDNTYEQEVAEVGADGTLAPESRAVLRRKRAGSNPAG